MNALRQAAKINFLKNLISAQFKPQQDGLQRQVFNLRFDNPVGLGAGFDKNALYINELEALGFGFAEIGTVTPLPQAGNSKPRLFRLPADKAIVNRMGFNNDGVKAVAERLRQNKRNIIIGGNIGKNKNTANNDAWKDYEICLQELFDCVDYFVVNVSSPNTPGLRQLQEKGMLLKILGNLQNINQGRINTKPLLLKISPDLTVGQLDDILELCSEVKLSGLVATNTTIDRDNLTTPQNVVDNIGAGGLSGAPLKIRSTQLIQYIARHTNGSLPVIASGGIFCGEDAKEKLDTGASLVQVWTGFIYEGPAIVKNICNYLVKPN